MGLSQEASIVIGALMFVVLLMAIWTWVEIRKRNELKEQLADSEQATKVGSDTGTDSMGAETPLI